MITLRPARDRGHADHGWLDSWHSFSFADYRDPRYMGFRGLRVINEDRVQPGRGFPSHSHQDMEILSYVLSGSLEHKDSIGNGTVIRPGDVQRMSAGSGVTHSEFNHSKTDLVHFLQIWLIPAKKGIAPGYEQKAFTAGERRGKLRLVASPDGALGSVTIHADARVHAGLFDRGESTTLKLAPARCAWVQVARGRITVNGQQLSAGDGAGIVDEETIRVEGGADGEVLVFDLV
jgi:redox-sensitive bicupin YhaK (pirin superfamily)